MRLVQSVPRGPMVSCISSTTQEKESATTTTLRRRPRHMWEVGERILADHPSVRDVALFGIPDDEMGECLVGLISVKEESITVEQLLDFCRSRIARYKVPKQLRVVDDIPRSPMGKVDKRALRYAFLDE